MGNFIYNAAKGAWAEKLRDGANIQVLAIDANGASDATLVDTDTVTDLLATAANEVTNSGYARKSISNASVTLTVDDTNDRVDADIADQTFASIVAGSAWTDLVTCEDAGGADGTRIPISQHDFAVTPDGTSITATIAVFARAA